MNKKDKVVIIEEEELEELEEERKPYYVVMGVATNASFGEIRDMYRQKCLLYHPDRPGGNAEKMMELSNAYRVLSDPLRRKVYDIGVQPESIDVVVKFHGFPTLVDSYAPQFVHSIIVDNLFRSKLYIMASALGLNRNSIKREGLGLFYNAVYPFTIKFVDYLLSLLLFNNNRDSKSDPISIKHTIIRALIIDSLSAVIAAPFEIGAFHTFKSLNGIPSGHANYYLMSGVSKGLASTHGTLKKLFFYSLDYVRTFTNLRGLACIAGIVSFRILYTLTNYFISSISEYASQRAITSRIYLNEFQQQQDKEKERDNNDNNNDNNNNNNNSIKNGLNSMIYKSRPVMWESLSYTTHFLSYFVPSTLFSMYRLFYRVENPDCKGYWVWSPLVRAGFLDSVSNILLDTFTNKRYLSFIFDGLSSSLSN